MMEEAEIKSRQRAVKAKKIFRSLVWFVIFGCFVGYGIYKISHKKPTTPPPGTFYLFQSREHIPVGSAHDAYNSSPPTGGWHYDTPAQTGIYDKELPDEQLVHNLEHSHVWISYRSDLLDKDSINKLADLAKKYGPKMIVTPRAKNDTAVAIVAWQYLEKFDKVDDASLKLMNEFIQYHRGVSGPENVLDFGFTDFRGGKATPSVAPMKTP